MHGPQLGGCAACLFGLNASILRVGSSCTACARACPPGMPLLNRRRRVCTTAACPQPPQAPLADGTDVTERLPDDVMAEVLLWLTMVELLAISMRVRPASTSPFSPFCSAATSHPSRRCRPRSRQPLHPDHVAHQSTHQLAHHQLGPTCRPITPEGGGMRKSARSFQSPWRSSPWVPGGKKRRCPAATIIPSSPSHHPPPLY